jgi:hypothetical protein
MRSIRRKRSAEEDTSPWRRRLWSIGSTRSRDDGWIAEGEGE